MRGVGLADVVLETFTPGMDWGLDDSAPASAALTDRWGLGVGICKSGGKPMALGWGGLTGTCLDCVVSPRRSFGGFIPLPCDLR